ncbi:hypothetical protein BH09PAT4_BH09PAT4_00360 [soil metagenome]
MSTEQAPNYIRSIASLTAVAALTLSACSAHENAPDIEQFAHNTTGNTDTASQPEVPEEQIVKVEKPWQAGEFQEGIQLYWHTRGREEDIKVAAERNLDYIVSLGANSVGITFPIFVDGKTPTKAYGDSEQTPTPKELDTVISLAKQRDLRVTIRPIIDEQSITAEDPSAWRGLMQPENTEAWFDSYTKLLTSYVPAMKKHGVEEIVVGSELTALQGDTEQWQSLQTSLQRAGYQGKVSYGLNWNNWQAMPSFKQLGLDAYPSIQLPDSASVPQLTGALSGWLEQISPADRKRLTIQEVGIAAVDGAYERPWDWGEDKDNYNFTVQARWFRAFNTAARRAGVEGIYYWFIDSNGDPATTDPQEDGAMNIVDRPAAEAIKQAFK